MRILAAGLLTLLPLSLVQAKGPILFAKNAGQIKQVCDQIFVETDASIHEIEKQSRKELRFENTILALENLTVEAYQKLLPLMFLQSVSTDAKSREAAGVCQVRAGKYFVDVFSREGLYKNIRDYSKTRNFRRKLKGLNKKLAQDSLRAFHRSGMSLKPENRKAFSELQKKMIDLSNEYQVHFSEYRKKLSFDKNQLKGLPARVLQSLKKDKKDQYEITLPSPHYVQLMTYVKNPAVRQKIQSEYYRIGGQENVDRLEKLIEYRNQLASMLGYKTFADYKFEDRMEKSPKKVMSFLQDLKSKLPLQIQRELKDVLEIKQKEIPKAKNIQSWDLAYYGNQLKESRYQINASKIQEYFPLQHVLKGMFGVYEHLFGVKFVEKKGFENWTEDIQSFEVVDSSSKNTLAYFYLDIFPREGKYPHAAAFPLRLGHLNSKGEYVKPVSAMIANFTKPTPKEPSLLTHSEVETLFHEFGHIVHHSLTKVKYGSYSGMNVPQDFVEAPSQMLEAWVWDKAVLAKMSSHYKTKKPLPDDLLDRMIQARDFQRGLRYGTQLMFALMDLEYHTQKPPVDTTKIWIRLNDEIRGVPLPERTMRQAGWTHMTGYEAGYYSYLWSEVFAFDMFTRFQKEGLLNPKTGKAYRNAILEKGSSLSAEELLYEFLGRKPNRGSFYRHLGLIK